MAQKKTWWDGPNQFKPMVCKKFWEKEGFLWCIFWKQMGFWWVVLSEKGLDMDNIWLPKTTIRMGSAWLRVARSSFGATTPPLATRQEEVPVTSFLSAPVFFMPPHHSGQSLFLHFSEAILFHFTLVTFLRLFTFSFPRLDFFSSRWCRGTPNYLCALTSFFLAFYLCFPSLWFLLRRLMQNSPNVLFFVRCRRTRFQWTCQGTEKGDSSEGNMGVEVWWGGLHRFWFLFEGFGVDHGVLFSSFLGGGSVKKTTPQNVWPRINSK